MAIAFFYALAVVSIDCRAYGVFVVVTQIAVTAHPVQRYPLLMGDLCVVALHWTTHLPFEQSDVGCRIVHSVNGRQRAS